MKGSDLSLGYDLSYQNEFPLHWENLGDGSTKNVVPTQLSHSVNLGYSMFQGRYNVSFEVRNLTDALLYDNFSFQKPGRS